MDTMSAAPSGVGAGPGSEAAPTPRSALAVTGVRTMGIPGTPAAASATANATAAAALADLAALGGSGLMGSSLRSSGGGGGGGIGGGGGGAYGMSTVINGGGGGSVGVPVPLLTPSTLEDFEPMGEDVATLREQLLRLRAVFVDTQRALFAAKADAAMYERELTALRWRNVTLRMPADVAVSQVSAGAGSTGGGAGSELPMRSPRLLLEEHSTSMGAQRSAALLAASAGRGGTPPFGTPTLSPGAAIPGVMSAHHLPTAAPAYTTSVYIPSASAASVLAPAPGATPAGTLAMRTSGSGLMSHPSRIAQYWK